MFEATSRPPFLKKTGYQVLRRLHSSLEDLDRHLTFELQVLGLEHNAELPLADGLQKQKAVV